MKRLACLMLGLVLLSTLFAVPSRKFAETCDAPIVETILTSGSTLSETEWVVDENWDDVSSIPAEWTVIDGDGDGNEWQIYNANPHSAPNSAGSRYNADGNDDWLISSVVSVEAGYFLDFWYASQDDDWLDAIEVLLSTTGDSPADFTEELLSVAEVPAEWTHALISLDAWVGEDVYIAFHNNSVDEFVLKVDDIRIGSLPDHDIALEGSEFLARVDPTGGFIPEITIVNNGGMSATVDVVCTIFNGSTVVYEETHAVVGLASGTSEDISFPEATAVEGDKAYNVSFEATLAGDATTADNSTSYPMVTWNSEERTVFYQKFTSVGCGYCPRAAVGLGMIHEELGDEVVIASYHSTTSFGADPFYLAEAVPFATAYGVTGYPTVVTSGFNPISGGYPGPDYGYTPYLALYDEISEYYTPFGIDVRITNITATGCEFTTTCNQVAELIEDSAPVLRYAVVQGTFDYTWGSSPSLDEIQHAVVAIPGGITGYPIDAERFTHEGSIDFGGSWDTDDVHLIAYIQDFTGEIYNVCSVPVNELSEEGFVYDFGAGWNLISYPFAPSPTADFLASPMIAPIFSYSSVSGAYAESESLSSGIGYWALALSDESLEYTGLTPVESVTINLVPGWNLIAGPLSRIDVSVITAHAEVIPPVYEYGVGYDPATYIDPFMGYWVLVNAPVTIVLSPPVH